MSQEPEGSGPAEETGEGGAERHPTDLLGSQGGSQGAPPDGAQPSGDQLSVDIWSDAKPAEELPRAVREAVGDPTDGWAEDDEKPVPMRQMPRRQTDELNGAEPESQPSHRRWWVWVIWIAAAIVVATFISLAVQNGEEKETASPATKPVVAQKVASAKSDKDKVAATTPAKKTSFSPLVRRDETLELYAKWLDVSVEEVLKWNNLKETRSLVFGEAVLLYMTPNGLARFDEARKKFHQDKRDAFSAKFFVIGYQKVKVKAGEALADLERKYYAPAWLLDRINPRLNLDRLKIGDEVTVPRVVWSAGNLPMAEMPLATVQPTDIMVVNPNAPDASSGASASTTIAHSETALSERTVVTSATSGITIPTSGVVGLAAGASEQAVAASSVADESVFRVTELEAKVTELQRKLDEAIRIGVADTAQLRKEIEEAKANLANAMATAQPDSEAPVPPASTPPPPVSTGSVATGSSAATHLQVDPAVYQTFCLKYGGTQDGCDRTLKDLQ